MNFAWNARLPHNIQGSFTCRKSTTWDKRLYFPSEGGRAKDFFALKNPTASAGFEPSNLGTKGQHATSRPLKSLYYAVCLGDKLTTFRIIVGPSHSKVKQSKKKKFLNYLTLKNVRNQEPKQSQHSPRSPCTRNTEPLEISLWQPHLSRLYIQLFIKWCCRYFILCKVDGWL